MDQNHVINSRPLGYPNNNTVNNIDMFLTYICRHRLRTHTWKYTHVYTHTHTLIHIT